MGNVRRPDSRLRSPKEDGLADACREWRKIAWESLVRGGLDEVERDRIEKALRDYCGLDTMAMVKLLEKLVSVSS